MTMETQELLKEIGKLIDTKLEGKFELQKDYIDSKFAQVDTKLDTMENRIYGEMGRFHKEIIEDIGKLDEKTSQTNAIVNTQAATIQTLKLKVG